MSHLPPVRFAPLLLAAVAAGTALLAGCGKEPAATPDASLTADGPRKPGRTVRPGTTQGSPVVSIPGPPLAVTVDQLAKDFQADDRVAEGKYKNRWLLVDGLCKEAYERDIAGTVSRLFYFKDYTDPITRYTWAVKCTADASHWPAFDGLTQGQKVKVKARLAGAGSQAVSLEDGEVVEAGPDPAVALPAGRLITEFAAHRDDVRRDYNDKWLLVEGTVQDTSTKDPPTITLDGAGTDPTKAVRIVARFRLGRETDPAKVKKGDKVKLKGQATLYLDDNNVVLDECKLVK
jgi:hypothetical protein